MTLDELGKDKRAAILAIAARHGVQRVRVFGSFARGDAGEDSDLDLLIEAGPRTPPWFPGDCWSIWKKNWAVKWMSLKRVLFIHSFGTACFTRRFLCEGRPTLYQGVIKVA
jgi:hypothetical protein